MVDCSQCQTEGSSEFMFKYWKQSARIFQYSAAQCPHHILNSADGSQINNLDKNHKRTKKMEKSQQWLDFTPQQSLKEAAAVFWSGDFAMGTRGSDPRSGGAIYADSAANQDQWNFMVMSGDKIDDTRIIRASFPVKPLLATRVLVSRCSVVLACVQWALIWDTRGTWYVCVISLMACFCWPLRLNATDWACHIYRCMWFYNLQQPSQCSQQWCPLLPCPPNKSCFTTTPGRAFMWSFTCRDTIVAYYVLGKQYVLQNYI